MDRRNNRNNNNRRPAPVGHGRGRGARAAEAARNDPPPLRRAGRAAVRGHNTGPDAPARAVGFDPNNPPVARGALDDAPPEVRFKALTGVTEAELANNLSGEGPPVETKAPHVGTNRYCGFWLHRGECPRGPTCHLSHDRKDAPPCDYGSRCNRTACRYNHDAHEVPMGSRDVIRVPYLLSSAQFSLLRELLDCHIAIQSSAKQHTHPVSAMIRRIARKKIAEYLRTDYPKLAGVRELNGNRVFWKGIDVPIETDGLTTDDNSHIALADKYSAVFREPAAVLQHYLGDELKEVPSAFFGVNSTILGKLSPPALARLAERYLVVFACDCPGAIFGSLYGGETTWDFKGDQTVWHHDGTKSSEWSHFLWLTAGGISIAEEKTISICSQFIDVVGGVRSFRLSVVDGSSEKAPYVFSADSPVGILPKKRDKFSVDILRPYVGARVIDLSDAPLNNDGPLTQAIARLLGTNSWIFYQLGDTFLIITSDKTFPFTRTAFNTVFNTCSSRTIDDKLKMIARAKLTSYYNNADASTEPLGSMVSFDVIFTFSVHLLNSNAQSMKSVSVVDRVISTVQGLTVVEEYNRSQAEELKSSSDKLSERRARNILKYSAIGVAAVAIGGYAFSRPSSAELMHKRYLADMKAVFEKQEAALEARALAMSKNWRGELPSLVMPGFFSPLPEEYNTWWRHLSPLEVAVPAFPICIGAIDFNPFSVFPFTLNILRSFSKCFRKNPVLFCEQFIVHLCHVVPYVICEEFVKRHVPYGWLIVAGVETFTAFKNGQYTPFWFKFALHGCFAALPFVPAIIVHSIWNACAYTSDTMPVSGSADALGVCLMLIFAIASLVATGCFVDDSGSRVPLVDARDYIEKCLLRRENYAMPGTFVVPCGDIVYPSLDDEPAAVVPHATANVIVSDYVPPVTRHGVNVGPLFAGCLPYHLSWGTAMEKASVCKRAVPARPVIESTLPFAILQYYMAHAFRMIPSTLPICTFTEWNSRFAPSRQLAHERAFAETGGLFVPLNENKVIAFGKQEMLPAPPDADFPEKIGRNISSLPDSVNVATGPASLSFTKWLTLHWDGSFPSRIPILFASGWTAERVSIFLHLGLVDLDLGAIYHGEGYDPLDWHNFVTQPYTAHELSYPYGLDGDFTTMDGTVNRNWLAVEQAFMRHVGVPEHVLEVFRNLMHARGRTPHGVSYTVCGTRLSGMATTSVCNSLITGLAHYYFLRINGITDARILVLGDDVNVVSKVPISHLDWNGYFKSLDMIYKPTFCRPQFLTFCSNYYWPCDTGLVLGPKPFRVMAKIAITIGQCSDKKKHIVGVCKGLANDCLHVPVLGQYIRWVLSSVCRDVSAPTSKAHDYHFHVECKHLPVPETYEFFEQLYGIPYDEVIDELNQLLFDHKDLYVIVNSPLFLHCYDIDINGLPSTHFARQESKQ